MRRSFKSLCLLQQHTMTFFIQTAAPFSSSDGSMSIPRAGCGVVLILSSGNMDHLIVGGRDFARTFADVVPTPRGFGAFSLVSASSLTASPPMPKAWQSRSEYGDGIQTQHRFS